MDFEKFKDHYPQDVERAISFLGQGVNFFTEIKARYLLNLTRKFLGDLEKVRALDVGCGVGLTDHYLAGSFGSLNGIDVSEGIIAKAREHNPTVQYQAYNGKKFPFADEAFDLVFTICVMQCVPPPSRQSFVQEMYRVTKKGGITVVFEHNPLNPLTRLVVSRCEMNTGLAMIAKRLTKELLKQGGFEIAEQSYILFFPWMGKVFREMEKWFKWLPLGAQYYVMGQKVSKNLSNSE